MKQEISVSRIEKFTLCPRRFVFNYHQHRREGAGVAAEAGKALHAFLETRKIGDVPVGYDVEKLAVEMSLLVPEEQVLGREVEFHETIEGVPFTGVVDLLTKQSVIDYKTTGSDLKWAKNTNKLKEDPQRLLYMEAFPDTERALWITGSWKSMSAVAHERKREKKDKERFRLNVIAPAEAILALPEDIDPLSLPLPGDIDSKTNMCEACRKFPPKGCEFQNDCFPNKVKTMRDVLKDLTDPVPAMFEQHARDLKLLEDNKEVSKPPQDDKRYVIENLYIDCFPMHELSSKLEYATDWLHRAGQEVMADLGVPHPMLVDFGKGPYMLSAEVGAALEAHEGKIEHFLLETKSAEGKALVQMLSARARHVIKGYY